MGETKNQDLKAKCIARYVKESGLPDLKTFEESLDNLGIKGVLTFKKAFEKYLGEERNKMASGEAYIFSSIEEMENSIEFCEFIYTEEKVEIMKKFIEAKFAQLKDESESVDVDIDLSILSETELDVITLRYGLDGQAPKTLLEVSNIIGVSRERVRQIESKAIKKLREHHKVQ